MCPTGVPARFVVRRRRLLNFASFHRISLSAGFPDAQVISSTTAPIEALGTRHFAMILAVVGTACGGPTAAFPGYAHDVVVSPQRATLAPGDTFRLTATGPTRTITWTSLNGGV